MQQPPVPISVIDGRYVTQQTVQLKLKEKYFSFSGDDFTIEDAATKQAWFKVKGATMSLVSCIWDLRI